MNISDILEYIEYVYTRVHNYSKLKVNFYYNNDIIYTNLYNNIYTLIICIINAATQIG